VSLDIDSTMRWRTWMPDLCWARKV